MLRVADLNSAKDIGDWVRDELANPEPDSIHISRVITQEIGRWFAVGFNADDIVAVADPPVDSGSPQWDALVEGIVAHLFHVRGLRAPAWTKNTQLEEGWAPNDIYSLDWHLLNVLSTPVELLDKGVIFARQNLDRL